MAECSNDTPAAPKKRKQQRPEFYQKYGKRYYEKNKHKLNRARRWRRIKEKYGLTPKSFYELLEDQGGCCKVCRGHDPGNKYGWHIDHDHKTDKVRAILCHYCNTALGHAKECPERLRRLAAYIEGTLDE